MAWRLVRSSQLRRGGGSGGPWPRRRGSRSSGRGRLLSPLRLSVLRSTAAAGLRLLSLSALLLRRRERHGGPRRRMASHSPKIEGMLVKGGTMRTNDMTRRAALLGFGAFASAGLAGCNTTPTSAVQPGSGTRHRRDQCRHGALGGLRGQSDRGLGAAGLARRARPGSRVRDAGWAPAQRPHRHSLSRRRRTGRSRPDERCRDRRRTHDQGQRELDLFFEPHRSGVAGAGSAGPRAGALGRLRLSAEDEGWEPDGARLTPPW